MKKDTKKIMVLVVAYNAERTIASLLDRIPLKLWGEVSEVVIADDCSQDLTAKVALSYKKKKKLSNLTVVRHEKNKGYGGNQKWGYDYAIKKEYNFVIMLHGDVQYSPEEMPSLLKVLKNGKADMVFGSRIAGNPLAGGMPIYKYLGNRFLTKVENFVLRQDLSEYHSGFRAYSINALKKIPFNMCSDNFHFDSEVIIQLIIAKQRISEVPISTHYGDEKCYVKVIPYGLNILKIMVEYNLNRLGIRNYPKFDIKNFTLDK